jgi:acyl-CoA thioesterase-1
MKSILCFILLLASILISSSLAPAAEKDCQQAEALPRVILLGDSIRMNYQAAATAALAGKAAVWAPKDNCRHTTYMLESLDRWLEEAGGKASVIHVNVGLHDMFLDGKTGKPRHSLELYEKNLRAIFAKLDELSSATVIFALTTAVNEDDQANSEGYKRVVRRNSDIDTYNARAREIAKESGIEVNDLNAFMKESGAEKILRPADGIHLSPDGCESMGKEVARVIAVHLPKPD